MTLCLHSWKVKFLICRRHFLPLNNLRSFNRSLIKLLVQFLLFILQFRLCAVSNLHLKTLSKKFLAFLLSQKCLVFVISFIVFFFVFESFLKHWSFLSCFRACWLPWINLLCPIDLVSIIRLGDSTLDKVLVLNQNRREIVFKISGLNSKWYCIAFANLL